MFHNRYTISIGRLAALMESHDFKLVKRLQIPIPAHRLKKAYDNLMLDVAETLNKNGVQKEIEFEVIRTRLYNKAYNLYPALCQLVRMSFEQKHLDRILEIAGIRLEKLEDRELLYEETRRLQDKYKEFAVQKDVETEKEAVSFTDVIISTGIILGFEISLDTPLFIFHSYMQKASEKIKRMQNGK